MPAVKMRIAKTKGSIGHHMQIAMIGLKGIPAVWGGMEKYAEEIGHILSQRGHCVTTFGSKWYCQGFTGRRHRGIRVIKVPTLRLSATDALTNAFFASAIAWTRPFDVIQFHGYASYYFVPFFRRSGKVTVVTAHGVESGWENPKYGTVARQTIRHAFKTGMTRAHCVTTVADHLRRKIRDNYRVDALVMPSGMDEGQPAPVDLIGRKYRLTGLDYLLFLGRIDPIKRVHWLPDLLPLLDRSVKIVIAGGPQDAATRSYHAEMIRRCSPHPQIVFTGPVSGKEKAELLCNCLLFLAPSVYEGLPIALLEAVSYGRCCVASRIPAHEEVITDGTNGYLFNTGDRADFMEAVRLALAQPLEAIAAFGSRAKQDGLKRFNWQHTATQYEKLFRQMVQHGPEN